MHVQPLLWVEEDVGGWKREGPWGGGEGASWIVISHRTGPAKTRFSLLMPLPSP